MVIPDHRTGNDRLIPSILQIHLCHRDVELTVQARNQRLDPSAFFFEGGAGVEVEMDGEGGDHFLIYVFRITIYNPSHGH